MSFVVHPTRYHFKISAYFYTYFNLISGFTLILPLTSYCRDRVSSCNRCSPTRYTKCFNEWVYSSLMLARHVSDLIGPHSKSANTGCKKRSCWWTDEVRNMSSWQKCWINSFIETLCVSCWTAYILLSLTLQSNL